MARARANVALAQKLLAESGELATIDQSLSAQLALAAYRIDPSPAARARVVGTLDTPLSRVLAAPRIAGDENIPTVTAGPRGHLAVVHRQSWVDLWDLDGPQPAPAGRIEVNKV